MPPDHDYSIRIKKIPPTDSEPAKWEASIAGLPDLGTFQGATPTEAIAEAVEIAGHLSNAGLLMGATEHMATMSARSYGSGAARGRAGFLHLRMPKALHERLAERARRQGVSLNQYATYLLAMAIGSDNRVDDDRAATA
jgi:predicted HicB family RNase H-like nuclease